VRLCPLEAQGWVVLPAEDGRRIGAGHRDALCDRRPGRRAGRGGAATVQGAGAGSHLHRAALGGLAGLRVKRVDLLHRRITVAEQLTETRGAFAFAAPKTAAGASTRELMVRMGHSSAAAALRYQHVMAGRDAAIAAGLDELVQAASALAQQESAGRSGTRVARDGPKGSEGRGR
jgi:hypothetical protein